MTTKGVNEVRGVVFGIERYAVHDGPGIRTLIFLKGCPLRCLWCDNPESQKIKSEIFLITDRCIGCGECLAECPQGAGTLSKAGQITINRKLCAGCGKCVETCYAGARVLVGKCMTVEDVLGEIMKDLKFYRASGGGVTLSGGEPLMQAEFAREVLRRCNERNIHTAIETSGYANWDMIEAVFRYADLVLLDIKHMDSLVHRRLTGVPNEPILENAIRVSELKVPMVVRIPIIPGFNDSEANIRETANFVKKLRTVNKIELLAYHSYGSPKYKRLGRRYRLRNLRSPTGESMSRLKEIVVSYGIRCEFF